MSYKEQLTKEELEDIEDTAKCLATGGAEVRNYNINLHGYLQGYENACIYLAHQLYLHKLLRKK